jgi:hypothetical protein
MSRKAKDYYPRCHKCSGQRKGRWKTDDIYECLECGSIKERSRQFYAPDGIQLARLNGNPEAVGKIAGKAARESRRNKRNQNGSLKAEGIAWKYKGSFHADFD